MLKLTDDEKLLGYRIENYETEYDGIDSVINEKGIEIRSEHYYK